MSPFPLSLRDSVFGGLQYYSVIQPILSQGPFFYMEKIPGQTTSQKYFKMTLVSIDSNIFSSFISTHAACLDGHMVDILGGNEANVAFRVASCWIFFPLIN